MNNRQKVSDTKIRAMVRMVELGFTKVKIAGLLGVSRLTVDYHTNPVARTRRLELTKEHMRDARIKKATSGNKTVVPRPHHGVCELCVEGEKLLVHYPYDRGFPETGLELCASCSRIAGSIDKDRYTYKLMVKYMQMKAKYMSSNIPNQEGV